MAHHRFYRDETERRKWQDPNVILRSIGPRSGQTFVDVGCGYGFFAIPAAKIVGRNGKVFAVDSDPDAIASLKEESGRLSLKNIQTMVGSAEETVFCEACADVVFFGIVLHDFRDIAQVLQNARRMLGPKGLLVDLDWRKQQMDFGPPFDIRFSEDQAKGLIEDVGLRVKMVREEGSYFYLIIAGF